MSVTRRGRGALAVGIVALLAVAVTTVFVVDFGGDEDSEAARRRKAVVTEANNGGEVTVAPNQPFVVDLEGSEDAPWTLPRAASQILARVSSSEDLDGSAGATFVGLEVSPGATITAERAPLCRASSPPCETPVERFEVTIRVVG